MIIAKHKIVFAIACIIFALIVYALNICSFISLDLFGNVIQDAYIIEGTSVYYSGEPVMSPWALFLYLTTQNTIFVGTVLLLLGISILFNLNKLQKLLLRNTLWSYIFVFYSIMNVSVFLFDCVTGFVSYYDDIVNFGFNFISLTSILCRFMLHHGLYIYLLIIIHYIYPLTLSRSRAHKVWPSVVIFLYFLIWYIITSFIGKFAFQPYEWYPYKAIMPLGLFTSLGINSSNPWVLSVFYMLLILVDVAIVSLVYVFRLLFNKRTVNKTIKNINKLE